MRGLKNGNNHVSEHPKLTPKKNSKTLRLHTNVPNIKTCSLFYIYIYIGELHKEQ
jgi:hypothetical protein